MLVNGYNYGPPSRAGRVLIINDAGLIFVVAVVAVVVLLENFLDAVR